VNGGELLVVSDADAWKVKRIRNNSHVVVTVCDFRGKVAPGAPSVEGTARLLDEAGTETGRALLAREYVLSRWGNRFAKILHVRRPLAGTPPPPRKKPAHHSIPVAGRFWPVPVRCGTNLRREENSGQDAPAIR
jgi:hypothetical protein